mmetsp:Transcript_17425/g.34680  ORF Transcript_17425/g.34680 Transcript_17425/m.34680 type:complete len:214 (+) Transcript_17425:434-1075(+)
MRRLWPRERPGWIASILTGRTSCILGPVQLLPPPPPPYLRCLRKPISENEEGRSPDLHRSRVPYGGVGLSKAPAPFPVGAFLPTLPYSVPCFSPPPHLAQSRSPLQGDLSQNCTSQENRAPRQEARRFPPTYFPCTPIQPMKTSRRCERRPASVPSPFRSGHDATPRPARRRQTLSRPLLALCLIPYHLSKDRIVGLLPENRGGAAVADPDTR